MNNRKEFNITGTCIPHLHYMVDTKAKIDKISKLIEKGKYFTINRPRQFGKTTTMYLLNKTLGEKYEIIKISFEGLDDEAFANPERVSKTFINQVFVALESAHSAILEPAKKLDVPETLAELNKWITDFVKLSKKKVVILIDEVDRASNHRLFLQFLGMLRTKYLNQLEGMDASFHSVILAGVHDIKNIKLKMRPDDEKQFNSPWNIATEFDIDMSFHPEEIATMLSSYEADVKTGMDISLLSNEIYKFTNGYPFLVSKIGKLIEEKLDRNWTLVGIQDAVSIILEEKNTLFDDLIKNIENNTDLSNILNYILVTNQEVDYNVDNPILDKGIMFGIFSKNKKNRVEISNKIFEIRIYNYLVSKLETANISADTYNFQLNFLDKNGDLEMEKVLLKFQEFVKETYSNKDEDFFERQGRLLLIAFVKPIINGTGFYYIESQHSYEKRSDMIITFNKKEYILEFKIWHGEEYHKQGLIQLSGYLESKAHNTGYLVAFNFRKNKEFTHKWNELDGKRIFQIIV